MYLKLTSMRCPLLGSHRWTNIANTIDSKLAMPNRAWPVHAQVQCYGNPGDKTL